MKTVLITGASRGIGRQIALKFSENGYNVAINYNKSKEHAENLCEIINQSGKMAKCFCADVSQKDEAKKMVEDVKSYFGGIDVLVNNAGISLPQGLFTDFASEDERKVFDVNVFGMMNLSREVLPHFVKEKKGKIINISSIWGISGASCEAIYSASKGAVISFTKALARELGPSGICVNCVSPGLIDTDMNNNLSKEDKEEFLKDVPLGKIGTPKDVANAVFFLASSDADYITGQNLTVDGGLI